MGDVGQHGLRELVDRRQIERAEACDGGEQHDRPVQRSSDESRGIYFDSGTQERRGRAQTIAQTVESDHSKEPFHGYAR